MDYYILLGIKMAAALIAAVIFGNGSVVLFNRVPVKWFEDEDGLPEELMDAGDGGRQRITSSPWKYIFTALFGICGLYMAYMETLQYELSVLVMLFVAVEIAIADAKYSIVPDQFNILLAVSAVGFIGFYDNWWEQLAGAAAGAAVILAVFGAGRLVYKENVIGGADLKFFTSMGLVAGRAGVICIFVITEFLIALHAAILFVADRAYTNGRRSKDRASSNGERSMHRPMLPYAVAAALLYFLFLRRMLVVVKL